MNKRKLKLLEDAFAAEIESAIGDRQIWFIQTKSKLAVELVEDGFLQVMGAVLPGRFPVTVEGFGLTELGRITYCASCEDSQ